MELSSRQWQVIREICAEQARAVVGKNYKPNVEKALSLGLDPSQIEEMQRITEATARKHMKQMDGAACPVVYVPLNESQTGRHAVEMLTQAATKILDLESQLADVKSGRSRYQSELDRQLNANAELQKKFDRQLVANEELRSRLGEQNERLRQADKLIKEMNLKILDQANTIRQLTDPVGDASFRNHAACDFKVQSAIIGGQPVLVVNDHRAPHAIPNTKFKDGDKWVDLTGKETFTFFRGEWRRQSEMEAFASAKKYT